MVKEGLRVGAETNDAFALRRTAEDYKRQTEPYIQAGGAHTRLSMFYRRVEKEYRNLAELLYAADRVLQELRSDHPLFEEVMTAGSQAERLRCVREIILNELGADLTPQEIIEEAYDLAAEYIEEDMDPEDILRMGLPSLLEGCGIVVTAPWLNP